MLLVVVSRLQIVSRLMSLLYARSTTINSAASALAADGHVARQTASSSGRVPSRSMLLNLLVLSGVVAAEWLRGFLKALTPPKLRELSDTVIEHA